ncbi:transcription factor BEE 2-like isoform X1 [Gossypium australe]|uniref:Transcription factor BEE 2-like isoform X1 n=1 Tax=Gossypium australe TaxID=47621 RepID=A0A5B6UWX7_9ROSI|nr:transcription factor BEE 2-like isoform X1 [Gossypium australe]
MYGVLKLAQTHRSSCNLFQLGTWILKVFTMCTIWGSIKNDQLILSPTSTGCERRESVQDHAKTTIKKQMGIENDRGGIVLETLSHCWGGN